jgi:hypothetical protein
MNQGIGKNRLVDLITKTIGKKYYAKISKIENLTKDFNSQYANRLFIYGDEIKARAKEYSNEIINAVTETEKMVEQKYREGIMNQDYSNYFFTTNNRLAFSISETDRRFVVQECTEKILDTAEPELLENFSNDLENKEILKHFFNYLYRKPLPKRLKVYDTSLKREIKNESLPAYIKMVYTNPDAFDGFYTFDDLFNGAKEYAKNNRLSNLFNKIGMGKEFKREFGSFYIKNSRTERGYEFSELADFCQKKRPEFYSCGESEQEEEIKKEKVKKEKGKKKTNTPIVADSVSSGSGEDSTEDKKYNSVDEETDESEKSRRRANKKKMMTLLNSIKDNGGRLVL